MDVLSLGFRTDLMFPRFDGRVVDRGHHTVVATPSNPAYWWGNFLLFDGPPREGDLERWKALFEDELKVPMGLRFIAFGIDGREGETGAVGPFLEDGFALDRGVVLTASELHEPARANESVEIRTLRGDRDWEAATENQIEYLPESARADPRFKRRQMSRYRAMSEAGHGDWFGAFLGDELVADLGVFHEGSLGRFQSVGTRPEYRRRGICATLVARAGRHALARDGIDRLVIVADEGSAAARLYESVGLTVTETTIGLVRPDPAPIQENVKACTSPAETGG